uniref:Uncharacterized protein n=1 Tax=Aegilops tauschii subsp. strangulata TaxID=200361 RepID=A0A453KYC3_AEGTS
MFYKVCASPRYDPELLLEITLLQPYEHGYTAPPRPHPDETTIDIRHVIILYHSRHRYLILLHKLFYSVCLVSCLCILPLIQNKCRGFTRNLN